jgi:hypothetical protein
MPLWALHCRVQGAGAAMCCNIKKISARERNSLLLSGPFRSFATARHTLSADEKRALEDAPWKTRNGGVRSS